MSKRFKKKAKTDEKHFKSAFLTKDDQASTAAQDDVNSRISICQSKVLLKNLNFNYETCIMEQQLNLFIQDDFMKLFFKYYPEFVCIDVVCEIPELRQLLILLISVDSNGHCEIASLGIINCKSSNAFVWICEMFKKHNPSWENVQLIVCDESCDRDTLKAAFPEKYIFTSFFHSMKAFKKDLSSLDNVTEQDINKALQLFEKVMFETCEASYAEHLKQMKQINQHIFNLFKKKWHVKREFWALGLHTDSRTFLKTFNVYLLSIRRKLKPLISSQETLDNVIRNFHSSIYKLRREWFQHFTKMFHSPAAPYFKMPVMQKYADILSPFGSELVYEQLKKSNERKEVQKIDRQSYYKIDETLVSSNMCCCNFYKFMKLPCSHILYLRKHLLLPQFVQSVRPSWILKNYFDVYFKLYGTHVCEYEKSKAPEMCVRFEEYVKICCELWSKLFNCSDKVSQERLEVLQTIIKGWKAGFDVDVLRSEKEDNLMDINLETLEDLPTDYFKELYGISVKDIMDSEYEFAEVSLDPDDNVDI